MPQQKLTIVPVTFHADLPDKYLLFQSIDSPYKIIPNIAA